MSNVPHYDQPEEQQAYYKKIVDLLDHYEDGWNLFIKAHKENNYDYPLTCKPEHENNPYIPSTWIELTDAVCQIIAKDKYELDVYPNLIEIIRSDQMLDAYTTTGLPYSYPHWSFGKRRMEEERKYDASKHMAYEIVINSNPCLSYCMDSNTPLLQMIVIAHAAYGHNAVFKNNYLFKEENTGADTILAENKLMRDYVLECEKRYGEPEVRALLNFCHAMQFVDTSDNMLARKPSQRELEQKRRDQNLQAHLYPPSTSVFNSAANQNEKTVQGYSHPREGEKNILVFMADNAPHMPEWKRNIMRMVSRISQYFKPQRMTQTLNEGMATFTHDKIITTMRDIGLIDYGMYQEYKQINAGVLYQQPGVVFARDEQGKIVRDDNGQPVEQLVGAQFNPYRLGLSILQDIERICKDPTEEDKKWFPNFAGESDWFGMVKHAVFSSSDETFIHQYLSPKVMRDLNMLAVESKVENRFHEVTAVHAGDGFQKMREVLAADKRIWDKLPHIELYDYQARTDRCLILRHHSKDGKLLDTADAEMILEYMHHQWEHPVVIESIDEDGEVIDLMSSPMNYDYTKYASYRLAANGPKP